MFYYQALCLHPSCAFQVVVRSVGEPTPSSVVSLEPLSADDWEIIVRPYA